MENSNNKFLKNLSLYVVYQGIFFVITMIMVSIYTRALSQDAFGEFSLFKTYASITCVFIGLNAPASIIRRYHDNNENSDDFSSYVMTTIVFSLLMGVVITAILAVLNVGFFWIWISIYSTFYAIVNIYLNDLRAKNNAKLFVFISVAKDILYLGITCFLLFNGGGYESGVYGLTVSLIIITIILFMWKRPKPKLEKESLLYTIKFSLPLIPHTISSFILNNIDRILIGMFISLSAVAKYSFIYQLSVGLNLVILSINQAWQPYFFDFLNKRNIKEIIEYLKMIFAVVSSVALGLIFFGKEITFILGGAEYNDTYTMLIPLCLGYVCVFLYSIYVNYNMYHKKTNTISINTAIAGALNIVLNYFAFKKFGYQAAAYTTLISYFVLLLLHYRIAKNNDTNTIKLKEFFGETLELLAFIAIFIVIYYMNFSETIDLILRIAVFSLAIPLTYRRYTRWRKNTTM